MRSNSLLLRSQNTRAELILLLVASLACALSLTVGVTDGNLSGASLLGMKTVLVLALVTGAAATALILVWHTARQAKGQIERANSEVADLRRRLMAAEAIVNSEPQVLIYWDHDHGLRVLAHSLANVPGLPAGQPELLRFGNWLEASSARKLKAGLDGLFADGRGFSVLLKTQAGGHMEADARAAGGSAVLRFRDVSGAKRELVRVLDQNRGLTREARAYRALLEALPMPVWLKSTQGRIEWVNTAYVKAVEAASESEVVTRQIELLEQRQRQAVAQTIATGRIYGHRQPLIVAGQRKPHDIVVLPFEDAQAGVAIDVAEIETARDELDRQIAAYDRTLDRVATAVAIFNRDQKLTFFNEAYAKLWQIDADWLETGPSDGEVLDRLRERKRLPEVVNYREWKAKLIERYKISSELEDWWHLPDGRVLHVISEQRPDGGVTYLYQDETERLSLESRFNAMIDVQRETLDSLKEGVAVFATDGRLKLFNSSFAQIWRLSRRMLAEAPHIDEIIRQGVVLYEDQRTWDRINRAVTAFSDSREPLEGQMVRPDGSVIDFAATPLPDGATLITFADVTVSKRYERALLERNEALIAGDRLKNQFISHVSYELRTPLTNIIGFSELLASPRVGSLNGKQREYLGDITSSSKTLLAIIDDILDLTTIDAGALELKLGRIAVKSVIESAVLGVKDRAARARLTLDITVAQDADTFVADEARVRQVLYNLLSNAVGFSKPGGTVLLACWRETESIIFRIEDQGIGIPQDHIRRVFERFESRSHGSKHRGAGLGLSIVKSLVELHGGEMALDSVEGRGTTVTVRFPIGGLSRLNVTPQAIASSSPQQAAG